MNIRLEKTTKIVVTGSAIRDKELYKEAIELQGKAALDRSKRVSLDDFETLKKKVVSKRIHGCSKISLSSVVLKNSDKFIIVFSHGGK